VIEVTTTVPGDDFARLTPAGSRLPRSSPARRRPWPASGIRSSASSTAVLDRPPPTSRLRRQQPCPTP